MLYWLSARATDKIVNRATKELFKIADTPESMLQLGEDKLKEYIKIIGLYPTKAKNIIALSKILVDEYSSIVPDKSEELEKLPGIGRKSANVLLVSVFDQPAIPVDTHVFRVSNRLHLSHGNNVLKVEKDLMQNIPKEYLKNAHHWLVLHGRYICKSQKPLCSECFLADDCPSSR